MSERNDGGPAFPEVFSVFDNQRGTLTDVYSAGGMSLRDYFAGKAMEATVANDPALRAICRAADHAQHDKSDAIAILSYSLADAMLKAREQ